MNRCRQLDAEVIGIVREDLHHHEIPHEWLAPWCFCKWAHSSTCHVCGDLTAVTEIQESLANLEDWVRNQVCPCENLKNQFSLVVVEGFPPVRRKLKG